MRAFVVADLGFGDAGKGSIVDYLVRREGAHEVVRYNGGAQAAHNVYTPDYSKHHTFAQWGSGTFVGDCRTFLSRFMMVNPLNMIPEAEHLQALGVEGVWERVSVDADALIITPFHRSVGRLREIARGAAKHGSCGEGIGEVMRDHTFHHRSIRAGHLADISPGALRAVQERKLMEAEELDVDWEDGRVRQEMSELRDPLVCELLASLYHWWSDQVTVETEHDYPEVVIFEGAQGVLLDEDYGFAPNTTWSRTTFENAYHLAEPDDDMTCIGVVRAYMTRHGAGPFPTEDAFLTETMPEHHNGHNDWAGTMRVGWTDLALLQYARHCVRFHLDEIAVTCLDRLPNQWQVCVSYAEPVDTLRTGEKVTPQYVPCAAFEVPNIIAHGLQVPLSIASYGRSAAEKVPMIRTAAGAGLEPAGLSHPTA